MIIGFPEQVEHIKIWTARVTVGADSPISESIAQQLRALHDLAETDKWKLRLRSTTPVHNDGEEPRRFLVEYEVESYTYEELQ